MPDYYKPGAHQVWLFRIAQKNTPEPDWWLLFLIPGDRPGLGIPELSGSLRIPAAIRGHGDESAIKYVHDHLADHYKVSNERRTALGEDSSGPLLAWDLAPVR